MPERMSPLPAATALPFVHPLDDFYARAGMRLPRIERLAGDDIPEPYRALLVHENDMTPTLEKYYSEMILAERLPLGTILRTCETAHSTLAKAFFRIETDDFICGVLNLAKPDVLYGRRANILDPQKRPLSEIVEILPPDGRPEPPRG